MGRAWVGLARRLRLLAQAVEVTVAPLELLDSGGEVRDCSMQAGRHTAFCVVRHQECCGSWVLCCLCYAAAWAS